MKQEASIKQDILKIKQSKQMLAILILLFVVLLFWVLISLITSQTTQKVDPELQLFAKPLTPVIETEVFSRITEKKEYTSDELSAFTIFKVLTSRDGRTERVVPIEITIDDLEPQSAPTPRSGGSLLEQEVAEEQEEDTQNPSEILTIPAAETPLPETSGLGDQLQFE